MSAQQNVAEVELHRQIADCYDDPLGFVMLMYPWGKKGTPLAQYDGPDTWQEDVLLAFAEAIRERNFDGARAVNPIRQLVSSGHGCGKSTAIAWIAHFNLSTRPHSRGTVTANTFTQLETRTWPTIQRWVKMGLNAHWFEIGTRLIYHKSFRESWLLSAQTCKEENSEAFAGQHAAESTSYYLLDEASNIPDKIWEVMEGGLSDGEPHVFAFGNPTRRTGKFYRAAFGEDRKRWRVSVVDSRTAKMPNKELHAQWLVDYGEDSDFFRVRVRGLPPRAGDLQFIDSDRVTAAQKREAYHLVDDPLILGVDVSRGGLDDCCLCFRIGRNARCFRAIRISGEDAKDNMVFAAKVAQVLDGTYEDPIHGHMRKIDMAFIDGTGVGGPTCDRLRQLGYAKQVTEVQFGAAAPDKHFANMRAYIWSQLRDWLMYGAIPDDSALETDLTGPGFKHDAQDRLVLESKEAMKKRGLDSPDQADATALTFSLPVRPKGTTWKPRNLYGTRPNIHHTGIGHLGGEPSGFMG